MTYTVTTSIRSEYDGPMWVNEFTEDGDDDAFAILVGQFLDNGLCKLVDISMRDGATSTLQQWVDMLDWGSTDLVPGTTLEYEYRPDHNEIRSMSGSWWGEPINSFAANMISDAMYIVTNNRRAEVGLPPLDPSGESDIEVHVRDDYTGTMDGWTPEET